MTKLQITKLLTDVFISVSRRRENRNDKLHQLLCDALIEAQKELTVEQRGTYESWHKKKYPFDW